MHVRDAILHIQQPIVIIKDVKFQPDWIKIFGEKVKKWKKALNMHDICLIMHARDTIYIN